MGLRDKINIGIVCALKLETQGLQTAWNLKRKKGTPWPFYRGSYKGLTIGLVICGIGKVLASAATQWLIDHTQPQILINWGCAGGIAPQIQLGEIIASKWAVEYDYQSPLPRRISVDKGLLDAACSIAGIQSGILATADQNGDTMEKRQQLWQKYRASACDWESTAVLRVALANQIPALALRVITDVGDCQFGPEFILQAKVIIAKTTPVLLDYISNLKQFITK